MQHQTRRVRHTSRSRTLEVLSKMYVTPRMLILVLGGDDLCDFATPSADDHIKLYVPARSGELEPIRRRGITGGEPELLQSSGFATMIQNTSRTAVKAGTPSQNHRRA